MSKNKGKFGRARPEIARPDEFLTGMDRLINSLKPHAAKIGVAIGGIALLSIGYAAYSGHEKSREARATALFSEAVFLAALPISEDGAAPADGSPQGRPPRFSSRAEQLEAALAELETLQDKYGGTRVARQGLLVHADLLMEAGRHEEAARLYSDYARGDGPPTLRLLAREGFGYALEAKALAAEDAGARQEGLAAALEAFSDLQPDDGGPLRDRALYHRGRLLASLGRRNEAVEAFRQVLEISSTELRPSVEHRLAALEADGE